MKLLILTLLFALPLFPARRWVGTGTPAGYAAHYSATNAGLQSAINDAQYGDTLILQVGTIPGVSVNLPYKTGNGWIDVESEHLSSIPEGHRAGPAHTAYMPKLQAASGSPVITADITSYSVSVQTTENTFTRASHGLAEGTAIMVDASRIGPYLCAGLSSPDADCTSARIDHFVHRSGTINWADGTPIWVYGHPDHVPAGFTFDRWYYVRDSVVGRFKVAETAGGAAIDITGSTASSGTTAVSTPYPIEPAPFKVYYVRNPTENTFQLSETADGEIIEIESTGSNVSYRRLNQKVRGWRFRGLEIEQPPGTPTPSNMLIYLGSDAVPRSYYEQPSDFVFDRNYIHGQPWENGPTRSLYINARNVRITNNTITENKTYLSGQSQAIFVLNSSGNLHIENNELSGQGESVMLGGDQIRLVGYQPTENVFRRNYFHRPLEWYLGVILSRVSGTLLRAQTWEADVQCTSASSLSPGQQCFAFRPNNETRCVIDENSTVAPNGSITGSWGFGVKDDCTFTFIHTGSAGDWTCTGDIVCDDTGGTLDWAGIVTRIRSGTITSGTISSMLTSYRLDMRHNFETKIGTRMLLEGNVFNGGWHSSGSGSGADCHVALNVRPSGGTGGPVSYWAQSSEHVFRNNIFKNGVCAIMMAGTSDNSVNFELGRWRTGGRHTIQNNLFYEIGSYKWGISNTFWKSNVQIFAQDQDHILIDHNSFIDIGNYSVVTDGSVQFRNQRYSNNIFLPRSGASNMPHVTNNSGGGSGWQSVMVTQAKCVTATCEWLKNAIVNASGSSQTTQYPNNGTTQSLLAGLTPATFAERLAALNFTDYAARNYRITTGAYAAGGANEGTDGRSLGADQDEIEALTGTLGVDVIAGRPEFARRANLILTPSTTTATLKFTPEAASTCTVQVWDNSAYSGDEAFDTTTGSGTARRSVSIPGLQSGRYYYGKLICGTGGADGIAILRFRTR